MEEIDVLSEVWDDTSDHTEVEEDEADEAKEELYGPSSKGLMKFNESCSL